jgi:hypothetical protein
VRADETLQDLPDPVLAGISAILGISLGQFYNGRPVRGLCWGATGVALFLLIRDPLLILPTGFFYCCVRHRCTFHGRGDPELDNFFSGSVPFSGSN